MRIRCIGLLLSLQELFELEGFVKLVLQVLMLTDLVLAMMFINLLPLVQLRVRFSTGCFELSSTEGLYAGLSCVATSIPL